MRPLSIVFPLHLLCATVLASTRLQTRDAESLAKSVDEELYLGHQDLDDLDEGLEDLTSSTSTRNEVTDMIARRALQQFTAEKCKKHPKICEAIKHEIAKSHFGFGNSLKERSTDSAEGLLLSRLFQSH